MGATATSGARLVRDVLLRDGSTLRLRSAAPEDLDALIRFYDGMSAESRYLRFHGFARTDAAARRDIASDGEDRVTMIGRHGDRIVALGGYDRLREPGAAEVAFAVADDQRGRGIATRLLEQLAEIGGARGITRLHAEVLAENRPMLGVFRRAGYALRREGAHGEVTVTLDITPSDAVRERIDERDHRAAVASLHAIMAPASVAVIDPTAAVVPGLPAVRCADELAPAGRPAPELTVVAADPLGPSGTLAAVTGAVARGSRGIVVIGHEHGDDATALAAESERLLEVVRAGGARMVGPHSLGVANTDPAVALHASSARPIAVAGRLAVCSQSGAIGIGLLGHAAARRLGISGFVSLGDRVDVSTNDLLEFWEEDPRTAAVMLYVETFGNPDRFARIARRVSRRKPILAVRGHRAVDPDPRDSRSHTAASLRGDAAVDALLHQAGVMRFRAGAELFDAAEFFERQPLPAGNRVAIVANSGGVATLARDACLAHGLTAERTATAGLPVDADPARYGEAVRRLLAEPTVDAVAAYHVHPTADIAEAVLAALTEAGRAGTKPVVATVLGPDGSLPVPLPGPRAVPNFRFPEACAAVLARGYERRRWLARPLGLAPGIDATEFAAALPELARHPDGGWLPTGRAEAVLDSAGLPVLRSRLCATAEEAIAAAASVGGPVALKADLPPPAHAGDLDGTLLGLHGADALAAGWEAVRHRVELAGHRFTGARVQPFTVPGADLLVGTVRDPQLGPLLAVGLGGRQAGLLAGAAFRLPPVTDVDAEELIGAAEGVRAQLSGFRGRPALDVGALIDLVLRFAALVRAVPEIAEADLNPVRLAPNGVAILDVRIRAGRVPTSERVKTW